MGMQRKIFNPQTYVEDRGQTPSRAACQSLCSPLDSRRKGHGGKDVCGLAAAAAGQAGSDMMLADKNFTSAAIELLLNSDIVML